MLFRNFYIAPDGRLRAIWRFALSIVVLIAANFLGGGIAFATHLGGLSFEAVYRPLLLIFLLAGFYLLLVRLDRAPRPLPSMGLGLDRTTLPQSLLGIALGVAMVVAALAIVAWRGDVSIKIDFSDRTIGPFLFVIFVLATAAMAEEVMFRGYPFQRLAEAAGPIVAVLVTAVFFGAAHIPNPNSTKISTLNTALFGVLIALAYLRTRSLWLSWGLHFGWNAMLGVVCGLPVSGVTEFAVLGEGQANGPVWLTGGAYGLEGSVTGTIVLIAATAVLLLLTRWNRLRTPDVAADDQILASTLASTNDLDRSTEPTRLDRENRI